MPLGSGKTFAGDETARPPGSGGRDVPATLVDGSAAAPARPPRRPRASRILVAAVLAGVLIGAVMVVGMQHSRTTPAPQPTAQPSASPEEPSAADGFAIPGCYNPSMPPFPRPIKLNIVGCASVAVALQDMSWSMWGPRTADAAGTAAFKICDPNCAAGYQLTTPVFAHAWNPQPVRPDSGCQPGLKIFADMILAFPKGAPPAAWVKTNTLYHGMPAVHYVNHPVTSPDDGEFIGATFCN